MCGMKSAPHARSFAEDIGQRPHIRGGETLVKDGLPGRHHAEGVCRKRQSARVSNDFQQGIEHGVVARRYGALGHGPSMYLTDPDGNTVELKGPPDADQTEKIADAIFKRRKKAR